MNENIIDIGIIATYVLLGLAAAAVVLSAIFHLLTNFKNARGGLVGLAVLAAILFFSYLISTNETYEAFNVGPVASQWVGGGIIATFILIGMAFVAAIFTEVFKLFR
jgi:hypothetical protein